MTRKRGSCVRTAVEGVRPGVLLSDLGRGIAGGVLDAGGLAGPARQEAVYDVDDEGGGGGQEDVAGVVLALVHEGMGA